MSAVKKVLGWIFAISVCVAVVVIATATRRLDLVNGTGKTASVVLYRGGTLEQIVELEPSQRVSLDLAPGLYELQIRHAWGEERVECDLSGSPRELLGSDKGVRVVNVAGAGALLWEETV